MSATGPVQGGFASSPDARVWYLRAVAAEVRGDLAEARRSLEWVARLDRKSPWPWVALARLSERAGQLPAALLAYDKALSIHPLAEARLGRGRVWLRVGDAAMAREDLGLAAEAGLLEPADVEALLELSHAGCPERTHRWLDARELDAVAEWSAMAEEVRPDTRGCATDPP